MTPSLAPLPWGLEGIGNFYKEHVKKISEENKQRKNRMAMQTFLSATAKIYNDVGKKQ